MRNKLFIIGGVLLGAAILALGLYGYREDTKEASAGTVIRQVDILGTGTSTAGSYNFGLSSATTSSSVVVVGPQTDLITFEMYPEAASTTGIVYLQVLGSSLSKCGASGGNNQNWVDVIASNTVASGITTINTATSTVQGTFGAVSNGKSYTLTNVNFNCMKVYVGGHNSNVYVKAVLKTLSY